MDIFFLSSAAPLKCSKRQRATSQLCNYQFSHQFAGISFFAYVQHMFSRFGLSFHRVFFATRMGPLGRKNISTEKFERTISCVFNHFFNFDNPINRSNQRAKFPFTDRIWAVFIFHAYTFLGRGHWYGLKNNAVGIIQSTCTELFYLFFCWKLAQAFNLSESHPATCKSRSNEYTKCTFTMYKQTNKFKSAKQTGINTYDKCGESD